MKHLPPSDFLRDLARRVDGDYDRSRLEQIADLVERLDVEARVSPAPVPGTTMGLGGATITHRPDIAYAEGALRKADAVGHGGFEGQRIAPVEQTQAAAQGEPGYLPVTNAIAAGTPATIQKPDPARPAETAAIGLATR